MGPCERASRVGAYHDGELSAAEREAFEAHVALCRDCADALAHLRSISALFAAARTPALTADVRAALDGIPTRERERVLVRMAAAMTAAAAGLLLAGAAWLWVESSERAAAPAWEIATMVGEPDTGVADDPDVQLAAWVVGDLSSRRNR